MCGGCRLGTGQGYRQRRVGAQRRFVFGAVGALYGVVDLSLFTCRAPLQGAVQRLIDAAHGLQDASALIGASIPVPQFYRLVASGGRARRDTGTGGGSVIQQNFGLDGRRSAGIQDLTAADGFNSDRLQGASLAF